MVGSVCIDIERCRFRYTDCKRNLHKHSFCNAGSNSILSMMMNTDVFHQMPENTALYQNQYDIKAGRWPERYNECVIVLTPGGNISDFMLYTLGLRDSVDLDDMIERFLAEEGSCLLIAEADPEWNTGD